MSYRARRRDNVCANCGWMDILRVAFGLQQHVCEVAFAAGRLSCLDDFFHRPPISTSNRPLLLYEHIDIHQIIQ